MGGLMYIFSLIIGTQLAFLFIQIATINSFEISSGLLLISGAGIIFITVLFCYIIQQAKYVMLLIVIKKTQNSEKVINICEKQLFKSNDKVLKSKLSLKLAEIYIQQKDYKKALKEIKKANPQLNKKTFNLLYSLPDKYKLIYYLKAIYLNTVLNNLLTASDELNYAKKYLRKFESNRKYTVEILRVVGMLEYAKGNYTQAEIVVANGIEKAHNQSEINELNFIIAKIYNKTQREVLSKKLMKQIVNSSSSKQLVDAAKEYIIKNFWSSYKEINQHTNYPKKYCNILCSNNIFYLELCWKIW